MGAELSQPQPQQQPRPQLSQPQPQPRPPQSPQLQAQQQLRPLSQQPQPQPQLQPQPPQPQSQLRAPQSPQPQWSQGHEGVSSRDAWLLSPQPQSRSRAHEAAKPVPSTTNNNNKGNLSSKELNHNNNYTNFPHKYEDILKEADSPVAKSSSREKLLEQLYAGVFLHHNTKKYWVEKKSNANCFMLYAKALSITWAEDHQYWKWVPQKEASGTITEAAELKRVCWLEVHGKFDTRKLTPGILYEVSFVVMLKDPAQGWEVPVNVRLVLPGGKKQQRKESLMEKLRVRWIEIPVGEFVAGEGVGEMEFSLYEYEGGMWKQGLVIKGVSIKPKN